MDTCRSYEISRHRGESARTVADWVAVEEPLEIRVCGIPITVTMRTPGDDIELAAGFVLSEGIVTGPADIGAINHCSDADGEEAGNVVDVLLPESPQSDLEAFRRNVPTTSSCGLCGRRTIEAVRTRAQALRSALRVPREVLNELPTKMRDEQPGFDATGGLHCAALVNASGEIEVLREDVGRHNAVDKVIGSRVLAEELPLSECLLLVSGRASFEIVQKALTAGCPFVAALSAPSSLAVEFAREVDMTLVGFLSPERLNVYGARHRIV